MKKVIFLASLVSVTVAVAWAGCGGDSDTGGNGGSGGTADTVGPGPTSASHSASASTGGPTTTGAGGGTGGMTVVSVDCNPVTNAPCAAGEACDAAVDDVGNPAGFQCFAPPNDVPACGACNIPAGPFCIGGYSCSGNMGTTCTHFCCTDADCGNVKCGNIGAFADNGAPDLGVCDDLGGGGGAGGAGGGGGTCPTFPAMAPSMGMCVMLSM